MRQPIFLLFVLCFSSQSFAQDKPQPGINISGFILANQSSGFGGSISVLSDKSKKSQIGGGFSFIKLSENYTKLYTPLYLQYRLRFNDNKVAPLVDGHMGYGFYFDQKGDVKSKGGIYANIGAGVFFNSKKVCPYIIAKYQVQEFRTLYKEELTSRNFGNYFAFVVGIQL